MTDEATVSVTVRLNAAVVERLDALAAAESLTRSAVIQRLCEREGDAFRVVAPMSFLHANFLGKLPIELPGDGSDPVMELVLRRPAGMVKADVERKPRRVR